MAKFTKKAIMISFMEILEKKSIDKITVKDICDLCEINRNTFYYYFCDIYDVLDNVFENEIEKQKLSNNHDNFYDDYCRAAQILVDNKEAVIHVFNSKNRHIIDKYLEKITEITVEYHVKKYAENILNDKALRYITLFYSYAFLGHTNRWIKEGMLEYDDELIKNISKTFENTLPIMIEDAKKMK